MSAVDPANILAGDYPPVPQTETALLIEALRSADRVSRLLNEISMALLEETPNVDKALDLLLRRFSDCSALHLFVAAAVLRLELPPDLSCPLAEDDDP